MAEEEVNEDEGEGESSGGGGKKKLIIIIAAVLLLLIGGVAGAYFMGLLDPLLGGGDEEVEEVDGNKTEYVGDPIFFDLEEIIVNLNVEGGKTVFLKMRISLELRAPGDVEKVEKSIPKVIDGFQAYLRELRVEDLEGSIGMYRLREELMRRAISSAAPAGIKNILFREMLIQ